MVELPSSDTSQTINKAVDEYFVDIQSINQKIHAEPELAYEEHKAHDNFVALLTSLGFKVTPHAFGLDTAFSADFGSGGRLVIFNSEYDALPGIGHACGHNLIASGGLAAFLGLVAALKKSGTPGRVRLLGTPAEEGGGGKLRLISNGAYKDTSACLMLHPGPQYLLPQGVTGVADVKMLANVKWRITFTGQTAHAAMEPWNGVNALDAVCLSYNGISMLRQHIKPTERIHGIITHGGDRPNVIPGKATLEYYVRSDTSANAEKLWQRVKTNFEGAAIATGCTVSYEALPSYKDLRSSKIICQAFVESMAPNSVNLEQPSDFLAGSTDMGNVTYECPSFHGAFGIDTEKGQGNHTRAFADAAGLAKSLQTTLDWAKGMAKVGWRVIADDSFHEKVKKDWEQSIKAVTA